MHNIKYYSIVTPTHTGTTIFDTHIHETYEINYILTPDVKVIIEDKVYFSQAPGDIFIIPPYSFHKVTAKDTVYRRKIMQIHPSSVLEMAPCLAPAFKYLENNSLFAFHLDMETSFYFSKLYDDAALASKSSNLLCNWENIKYIGELLNALIELHHNAAHEKEHNKSQHNNNLAYDIMQHINHNIPENLTNEALAEMFGISTSKLYKIIKGTTGLSIKEYIISLRMTEAVKYLQQGFSVTEVANRVGYSSYAHFIRIFKKYMGMPPHKYLKNSNF